MGYPQIYIDTTADKLKDQSAEDFRNEFYKDVQARRTQHQKNNYHYLQYKGILWMNSIYGEDYLRTVGLQAFVPRTFMTIESIRSRISKNPLDISVSSLYSKKERNNAKKSGHMLKAEWKRSKSEWQKNDAEWYSLVLGTGFLLSRFWEDERVVPVFQKIDKDGKPEFKDESQVMYKGMKAFSLNPWYVFPDRQATSDENWRHCWIYSMWDFAIWKAFCKANDYNTEGMEKGGYIEEFDRVRREIDSIYAATNINLKTRDNGTLVSEQPKEKEALDTENLIMVVEKLTPNGYEVRSGANWTQNIEDVNNNPDKIIPIFPIRDYAVPDEFDGVGEAELIRWQQYQENKAHNLAYMSVLMNTVQRYGIIEQMLVDPVEAEFSNPLRWIKMKPLPGMDINKAITPLNQKSSNDVPDKFLNMIKTIAQEATGANSYLTSSPESTADTLGEANIMVQAGLERITQKIYEIEQRDLVKLLDSWLACIPMFYTEEMDLLLTDGEDNFIKYLPYPRSFNGKRETILEVAMENGVEVKQGDTLETLYKTLGYQDVVFIDEILGRYNIEIKTAVSVGERQKVVAQFNLVLNTWITVNQSLAAVGMPPKYDIGKLADEMARQFPDLIKNVEEFYLPQGQPGVTEMPQAGIENEKELQISEGL